MQKNNIPKRKPNSGLYFKSDAYYENALLRMPTAEIYTRAYLLSVVGISRDKSTLGVSVAPFPIRKFGMVRKRNALPVV